MNQHVCHDCDVLEGQIHRMGCDMECCPFCGDQLISCDCYTVEFGLVAGAEMTSEQDEAWIDALEQKGRVPYIAYPNICVRCGKLWPDLIMYSNEEWEKYIQPDKQREVVCDDCFQQIKEWIDNPDKGKTNASKGGGNDVKTG